MPWRHRRILAGWAVAKRLDIAEVSIVEMDGTLTVSWSSAHSIEVQPYSLGRIWRADRPMSEARGHLRVVDMDETRVLGQSYLTLDTEALELVAEEDLEGTWRVETDVDIPKRNEQLEGILKICRTDSPMRRIFIEHAAAGQGAKML